MTTTTIVSGLSCGKRSCRCAIARKRGQGLVHCPAHPDGTPSLNVRDENGIPLWKCFSGCTNEAVCQALRELGLWGESEPRRRMEFPEPSSSFTEVEGLSLQTLAIEKRIPNLHEYGVTETTYQGKPAVRIPYYDEHRREVSVRFRVSLTGDRFRWAKGSQVMPYGLWMSQQDWVLVVEGESDCWAAWNMGVPALGIPGKSVWREQWRQYLDGKEVYIWQEPGADDFSRRIATPDSRIILAPCGIKDISEAHLHGLGMEWLEYQKSIAVSMKFVDALAKMRVITEV